MRTKELAVRLRREITDPTYHRTRDEKRSLLDLCSKLERAELVLRQIRREVQMALHLPPGRATTSGSARKAVAASETKLSSRLEALYAEAGNAAKGPPGSPEVPDVRTATQEVEH